MTNSKSFKAAIFDMDGLLIDSERVIMKAWMDAASALGLTIELDAYKAVIGRADKECNAILAAHLGSSEAAEKVRAKVEQWLAGDVVFPLKPGAHELLTALHVANIPCAVASSSYLHEVTFRLRSVGVLDFFTVVTAGDEVEQAKPNPAVYLLAAKRLGISSEDCVVFEDSENGSIAALAARAQVVIVPDLKEPSLGLQSESFAILKSLDEAIPHIQYWFNK